MRLTLILIYIILISPSEARETCTILNHFIFPNQILTPDYPKNDVCRYRETPHCCTRSVEAVMTGYAQTDAHALFFSHLARMRDQTQDQYYLIQNLQLPHLSEPLRKAALQYKLLDNISTSRASLVTTATLDLIDMYYPVERMPQFCKDNVVRKLRPSVDAFLQGLVFSHGLAEANWNTAQDLFAVVFSARFSRQCVNDLVRAGLTRLSCKTCTDHTVKIPTCFDYCVDVVESCLEPYQPIIVLINEWFNLYTQVQSHLKEYIYKDRFLLLKEELDRLIQIELKDDFYSDVCEYHFLSESTDNEYSIASDTIDKAQKDSEYSLAQKGRQKRLAKTLPHTKLYSTRALTFAPTSVTPHIDTLGSSPPPAVAGLQLFDYNMLCYNATKTITNRQCWNGEGVGEYHEDRIPTTERPPPSLFDIHLPRLRARMDDLSSSLDRQFVLIEPTKETNEVEDPQMIESSAGRPPYFNAVMILIIVLTWIKLMI